MEHDALILEVKLELQAPKIVFIPIMDTSLSRPTGLLAIVNSMIANILNITDMIPLVAQPPKLTGEEAMETFTIFIEAAESRNITEVTEIENMHMDITSLSRELVQCFEKYNFP